MSSLRNVIHRREHQERAQPSFRKKLGLLEKHQDYVKRARDFHKKEKVLKGLQEKADLRNPDEFYFGMVNAQTSKKDGKHLIKSRDAKFKRDELMLLQDRDEKYLGCMLNVEQRKIEKLSNAAIVTTAKPRKHVLFVDDKSQVKKFDVAARFNTDPEFMSRNYNRPRTDDLIKPEWQQEIAAQSTVIKKLHKERKLKLKELEQRLNRREKLKDLKREMEIRSQLKKSKEWRIKKGTDQRGLPVYKFKPERKR